MAQSRNINIIPNSAITRVHVSQGDIGRTIYFNLYEGSIAYTPTSGDIITCVGTKPSGLGFTVNCTWSGNVVTCVTTEEMTDESGIIDAELVITSSDESTVLGTSNFKLCIEKNPHPDTTTDGNMETLIPELTLLVNEVKEYAEEIESTYHAYGSPWVASTVSAMTDTTKIYVYTGSETGYTSGNWYYYNGTAWVSGGVYNSVAVNTDTTLTQSGVPADSATVGSAVRTGLHITTTRGQTAYNDGTVTGTAISTTSRWFLNGFAYGRILSVAIRFRLAGSATVEVWEKNGNTLSRIHTETVTSASNYTLVTTPLEVYSDYPMMVSIISDTTNGIYQLTDTSKDFNARYISDKTSDTLSYSSLNTFTGLCVIGYVNYIYSQQESLVATVSPKGIGDYTTIAEAVANASDGDTILVYPGTYTEPIEAWGKTLDIIGVDKKTCIITNDTGNYSTPAVEIDSGRIANFTIISNAENPTTDASDTSNYMLDYSIHVDNAHAQGKTLIIEDCIIRNNHRTALGIGCYQDNTVIVRNCDIWADVPPSDIANPLWNKRGAIYFHNRQPSAYFSNVTGQKIRFINNTVYCEDIIALYIGDTCNGVDMEGNGWVNEMEAEFINNMICAKYANGTYKTTSDGIATPTAFTNDSVISGTGFTDYLKLSTISYGNNINYLNA